MGLREQSSGTLISSPIGGLCDISSAHGWHVFRAFGKVVVVSHLRPQWLTFGVHRAVEVLGSTLELGSISPSKDGRLAFSRSHWDGYTSKREVIYHSEPHSSRSRSNQHPITVRDAWLPSRNPCVEHGIVTWRDKVADVQWGYGRPAARR